MAKFLDTTGVNFFLQQLIKEANVQLILVSPYLQVNDRIRELLEDKNRMKVDVRIVYGKVELRPDEITWLSGLDHVRTSFCKNLHAKCYLSENSCIVTSMNLYEFSQVNNNEMGICIDAVEDKELYRDAKEEVQRIVRVSDTVRMSAETVAESDEASSRTSEQDLSADNGLRNDGRNKLTTSRLAKALGLKTKELNDKLVAAGYLRFDGKTPIVTDQGKRVGGEMRPTGRFGPYCIWPSDLKL